MTRLLFFFSVLLLFSCSNNSTSEKPIQVEVDYVGIIKNINDRLHIAFGNETVIRKTDDNAYKFALKNGDDLEFYFELGYDSEGWPMAGDVYYFYKKQLIGYAYIYCDGCIGQDISNRLKSLPIKKFKSEDDLNNQDVIWALKEPNNQLNNKATDILNKNLDITSDEKKENSNSYGEIRGRLIGGYVRMVERELGEPQYREIATKFIERRYNMQLSMGLFDMCLGYQVYGYSNYFGDGEDLLVILDNDDKVTNVFPESYVEDVKDICCCK
jgi:hypothetical protein